MLKAKSWWYAILCYQSMWGGLNTVAAATWQESAVITLTAPGVNTLDNILPTVLENNNIALQYRVDRYPAQHDLELHQLTLTDPRWEIATQNSITLDDITNSTKPGDQNEIIRYHTDDNGATHIFYKKKLQIGIEQLWYGIRQANNWQAGVVIPDLSIGDIETFETQTAIDTQGKAHLLFQAGNKLLYTTNKAGTWQTSATLFTNTFFKQLESLSPLVIDAEQYAHVSYTTLTKKLKTANRSIVYANNRNGKWQSEETDRYTINKEDRYSIEMMKLNMEPLDKPEITYIYADNRLTTYHFAYISRNNMHWEQEKTILYTTENDSYKKIHNYAVQDGQIHLLRTAADKDHANNYIMTIQHLTKSLGSDADWTVQASATVSNDRGFEISVLDQQNKFHLFQTIHEYNDTNNKLSLMHYYWQ